MNEVRTCRLCDIAASLPQDTVDYIQKFLAIIPSMEQTPRHIYESRLSKCEGCNKLSQGTCLSCGCYVQMRAAVKTKSCPMHRW